MELAECQFLRDRLDEIRKKAFSFQLMCDDEIYDKNNVILSMPTGSGKTDRFLAWAINILLAGETDISKVIITSPIKALSNQRFRELYLQGYNVGLETGDISYNADKCTFLCCTQEIATNKYLDDAAITIIDEFHYIYSDQLRARTYIDYIVNSKAPYLFLCSATFGDLSMIKNYLDKISKRDFFRYESNDRLTNINIESSIKLEDIKNAYVVSFSHDKCVKYANRLRHSRMSNYKRNKENEQRILRTASKYKIEDTFLIFNALYGVAYYYGSMLPKERLFILELFQNHLIDTVFGTDAISLGVNFPIEKIVFTSLRKQDSLINKNLFNQIIGRAGRYGLYANGYVYYSLDFNNEESLKTDYEKIINSADENAKITIMPSIKNIISGKRSIDEEIRYVMNNSTESSSYEEILMYIQKALNIINNFNIEESLAQLFFNHIIMPHKYKVINWDEQPPLKVKNFNDKFCGMNSHIMEFYEQIVKLYDDEFSAIENCILLRDIICDFDLDTILKDGTGCFNGDYKRDFKKLLQVRKYLNNLPEVYRNKIDLVELDTIISKIDASVFDVKLSFQEYSNFDIYDSLELSKRINISIKDEKKNKEDSKSLPKKEIIQKNKSNKPFEEGTLIKEAGAPFAAPMYMVLLYDKQECLLLNYNSYLNGFVSLVMQPTLNNFFQMDKVLKSQYQDALLKCRANSSCFFSDSKSTKKQLDKIKKLLK